MSGKKSNIKGLGDLVKIVTVKTGIDYSVKLVSNAMGIDDCGCDARQEKLNVMFPFGDGKK